jgi:chaperonin GroES
MSLKIKPLEDRVVIEAMAADETTASGIILPDTAQEKASAGDSSCCWSRKDGLFKR